MKYLKTILFAVLFASISYSQTYIALNNDNLDKERFAKEETTNKYVKNNKFKNNSMNKEYFKHTVFFWLKDPKNSSHREAFEASLKKFINSSKYIESKHLGMPANTDRDVIDSSYTYCLSLGFSSKENHDMYQNEPAHKLFLEESSTLWKKVLVYDSINML